MFRLLFLVHFQNEIKAHSFFSSINWDDLEQKKIAPPFTPNVVNISLKFEASSAHTLQMDFSLK